MMTGAILTQNTAWVNVEKALHNLKKAKALSPAAMHRMTIARVAELIRPSGTFHVKARRLKNFSDWLHKKHGGSLRKMFREPTAELRRDLLDINGIGPETADSMLLYAGKRPVFVVDAYIRRILKRHGWLSGTESYDEVSQLFHRSWPSISETNRVRVYNEYHALLVELAKRHCRSKPACEHCPLKKWLPPGGIAPHRVSTPKRSTAHRAVVV